MVQPQLEQAVDRRAADIDKNETFWLQSQHQGFVFVFFGFFYMCAVIFIRGRSSNQNVSIK